MLNSEQTRCPEPGCVSALSAPAALGWTQIGDLWWCPLHALGESRRLQKQHHEVLWYDSSIRLREQAVADFDTDKEHVLARAKAARIDRKDPRVKRQLAALDDRADRVREELTELQDNRVAAITRNELENENRLNNLQFTDEVFKGN
jgi:hypothetical protein